MAIFSIKRGLNIPIAGSAKGEPAPLSLPKTVAYDPREFTGIVPRLSARPGDKVKRGTPLFHSKDTPELKFLSPASGIVKEVQRGHRRVITAMVVEVSGEESESFPVWSSDDISSKSREEVKSALLSGGVWPSLRTRPLDQIARPDVVPQAILICGTETGPCQPGVDALLDAEAGKNLQAGIHALAKLTDGAVHLTSSVGSSHPAFSGLTGVQTHQFSGPHPAGDASVQINHVQPPAGNGQVWYISASDAARVGELLLTGSFPNERVYAAVGEGVATPRLVRTLLGAPYADVVGDVKSGEMRWIRGSVLTGTTISADSWGGYFSAAVHVLPTEVPRSLFGWAMPMFGTWSPHRAFLTGFFPGRKERNFRPGVYGGHRGLVPVGAYRKVIATPDLHVEFLMRAMSAGDLAESISLGLLDLTKEEAALCTYVCPSKIEMDVLLQQGLELYQKEA